MDTAGRFARVADNPKATEAIEILERDFLNPEAVGPARAAAFIAGGPDENVQADVAAFVRSFLDATGSR